MKKEKGKRNKPPSHTRPPLSHYTPSLALSGPYSKIPDPPLLCVQKHLLSTITVFSITIKQTHISSIV